MTLPVVFTRADLPRLHLSRRDLTRALADGAIVQPFRGVYLRAEDADEPSARLRALAAGTPAGAAVVGAAAAWVHGIDAREPGRHLEPVPLSCVVPVGMTRPRLRDVVAHEASLLPGDIVVIGDVAVTSPERTALDLARHAKAFMGLAVLDAMAGRGLIDPERLLARLGDLKGQRGVARARRLVGLCEPSTESYGESWLRLRIIDAGFPRPTPQIWICDMNGRPLYRLDLGWPELKLASEYDGEEFHSSVQDRARDIARRDDAARRFGWTVVGVRRGDVLGPSMALEAGLGQLLGMAPTITRRPW